jgi:hypothetical protein
VTSNQIVALVVGIIAVVGAVQAVIWIPIVRKLQRMPDALRTELGAERVLFGPERASFCGATAEYGRVGGIGVLALTERRLAFRRAVGNKVVDVPADHIVAATEANRWMGRRVGGRTFLIVKLASGAELGFIVADHAGCKAAIDRLVAARAA